MSSHRSPLSTFVLALVLGALGVATPGAQGPVPSALAAHSAVVIIINAENATKPLSIGDLRRILLGEMTRWPNGGPITIAMRPPGQPERAAVLRLICGMTDADFTKYLLQAAYRGEKETGIKQLDTATGVRRFVFNVPGAIGFVRGDEVDGSVRRLSITGDIPTDAAFGLTLRQK
jgi:ABC-type phosphate transport system substrate-binding protein